MLAPITGCWYVAHPATPRRRGRGTARWNNPGLVGFASTFWACASGIAWSRLAKCSFEGVGNSFVATFWRRSLEFVARGKNPIITPEFVSLEIFFIDKLHTMHQGVFNTHCILLAVRGPPWISEHHLMFHMLLGPRDHQTSRLEARNEH